MIIILLVIFGLFHIPPPLIQSNLLCKPCENKCWEPNPFILFGDGQIGFFILYIYIIHVFPSFALRFSPMYVSVILILLYYKLIK